jgi:hypothetical protein
MRHQKIEAELDYFIKRLDSQREIALQETVDYWLPKIVNVERRLRHAPEKFAYEIRQCERMKELLRKQKYFGDGFQRMLRIYSLMTR